MAIQPAILLSTLLLSGCSTSTTASQNVSIDYRSLQVEGEERSFVVHIPDGVEPLEAGLILAFHGWDGTGIGLRMVSNLDLVAREVGAVIAYPDAAGAQWAEDCDCVPADTTHGVADTAFVSAILDNLTEEFGLDPNRRYAVGFSQGGLFSMRVACQMANSFSAVAEVASTMSVSLAERCEPATPISILTILSQRDGSFPWEGLDGGWFHDMGAEATTNFWGNMNGCSSEAIRSNERAVLRVEFEGCDGDTRVKLIGPEDGGHLWEVSPEVNTGQELVDFFTR